MALYLGAALLWAALAGAVDVKVRGPRSQPGGRGTTPVTGGALAAPQLRLDLSGSIRTLPGVKTQARPRVEARDQAEGPIVHVLEQAKPAIPGPIFDPSTRMPALNEEAPLEAGDYQPTGMASADAVGTFLKGARTGDALSVALDSIFDGAFKEDLPKAGAVAAVRRAYDEVLAAPDDDAARFYVQALEEAQAIGHKAAFEKKLDQKLIPRALTAVPSLLKRAIGQAQEGRLDKSGRADLAEAVRFWDSILRKNQIESYGNLEGMPMILEAINNDAEAGAVHEYVLRMEESGGFLNLYVDRLGQQRGKETPPAPAGVAQDGEPEPASSVTDAVSGWFKGALDSVTGLFSGKKKAGAPAATPRPQRPLEPAKAVVHVPRKVMGTALGYKLYHAAPDGFPAVAETDEQAMLELRPKGDPSGAEEMRRRFDHFNALIEANFAALELIAQGSGNMTVKNVRVVMDKLRLMHGHFEALGGRLITEQQKMFDEVLAGLEQELKGLPDGELLPPAAVPLVMPIETASLHAYVNYLHQLSLDAISGGGDGPAPQNLELILTEGSRRRKVPLMDLSENPIVQDGRVVSPTLKALVQALRASKDRPKGSLIMQDHQFWGHFKLGHHSAEVYANFLPPDEGGMIRVRYQEWGSEIANKTRLYYVGRILQHLGLTVKQEKGFLTAVVDKDHESQTVDEMMESFSVLLQALHSTVGVDYALPILLDGSPSEQESARRVDLWVQIVLGEGSLPFYKYDDHDEMVKGYREHVGRAPQRAHLRHALNLTLKKMGLPAIPASAALGQLTIDKHYNRVIEEAIARGDVRVREDGVLSRPGRSPLEYTAAKLMEGVTPARMAEVVSTLDPTFFSFQTVGAQGGLLIQRSQRRMDSDSWLILHALRDPDTGLIVAATAELGRLGAAPEALSPKAVFALLARHGYPASAFEPSQVPPAGLAKIAGKAKSSLRKAFALGDVVGGMAASPGHGKAVVAMITYDKKTAAAGGKTFIAPFTTPDDLEAIRNSKAVLTTSGGLLSHAAITTRELGIPAVILGQAVWQGGAVFLEVPRFSKLNDAGLQVVSSVELRRLSEGSVIHIDPASGQIEIYPDASGHAMHELALAMQRPAAQLARWLKEKLRGQGMLERFSTSAVVLRDIIARAASGALDAQDLELVRASLPQDSVTEEAEGTLFEEEVRRAHEDITADGETARESLSTEAVERALLRSSVRLDRMRGLALALKRPGSELKHLEQAHKAVVEQSRVRLAALLEADILELREHARLYPSLTMETLPKIKALVAKAKRRRLSSELYAQWEGQLKELESARARRSAPAVLPLTDVLDIDVPFVGGKAAKLGEIMQVVRAAGGRVPPGLALSVEAYRQFLREAGIASKLESLAADKSLSPERRAAAIQQLILQAPLSADGGVGLLIMRSFKLARMQGRLLAVRSSAVDEDGAEAAFAGAGDTHLYVSEEELLEHVKRIWASLWNQRALIYREAKGLSTKNLAQAVVVQVMADSEVSGILFTQDPVSGNSGRMIVNSVWGLGEGAVSGRVAPDQYVLSKRTGREILPAMIADKKLSVVRDPVSGKGTVDLRVEARLRRARSLSPAQLKKLAAVSAAVENHFGYGLDIEWGFVGDELHVLQARPITQAQPKPVKRKKKVFFVCTGNTCRSPMAEYMAKTKASKAGLENLQIESRGLAASAGNPISPGAEAALKGFGADGSAHRSRQLTEEDAAAADVILVMTPQHAAAVVQRYPAAAGKVRLLGQAKIDDPYSPELTPKAMGAYERAAAQISAAVDAFLAEER